MAVNSIDYAQAVHPVKDDGVEPVKEPISPPELELFAQRLVSNLGSGKSFVIQSYKEAGLDPLVHSMFKEWADVPAVVKGRVKWMLSKTASQTVASKRETMEFLTQVMRNDVRVRDRDDYRALRHQALDAAKELCKINGWYSPTEVKVGIEHIIPDSVARMSDEQLRQLAYDAKEDVVDVESEIVK